tara:strand:+ start:282 stop:629 length:348 start_codon:yes stop_codon:yes gene_type:complete
MRLAPIYQEPNPNKQHSQRKTGLYLLRHVVIDQPNQVGCVDISYILMRRGFLYMMTIMNGYSHKLQARWLSRTLDAAFCIEALKEAVASKTEPMKTAAQEQTLVYPKKTAKWSQK